MATKTTKAIMKTALFSGQDRDIVEQVIRTRFTCETCKQPYLKLNAYYGCAQPTHSRLIERSALQEYLCTHVAHDNTTGREVTRKKEIVVISGREVQILRLLERLEFELGGIRPAFTSNRYRSLFWNRMDKIIEFEAGSSTKGLKKTTKAVLEIGKWYVAYGHKFAAELQFVLGGKIKKKELQDSSTVSYCHSGFDHDGKVKDKLLLAGFLIF